MRLFALWLLLVSILQAEEELSIEAFWLGPERFRLEMAPEYDDEMPERIDTSVRPEASRFINEKDVLWDLSAHFKNEGFEIGEGWIVYNHTTGFLVANTHAESFWALERRFDPENSAKTLTVNFEFFEIDDKRAEWVDWGKALEREGTKFLFAAEVNGRSGETQTSEFKKKDLELSLEVQPTLWEKAVDIRIAPTLKIEEREYQLNTGFTVTLGEDYYLELGQSLQGPSLLARIKVSAPLVGGPCLSHWHLREQQDVSILKKRNKKPKFGDFEISVQSKARIIAWKQPPSFAEDISYEPESDLDPFAADSSVRKPKEKTVFVKQHQYAELRRCFPNENWLDLKSLLSESGLDFGQGDYALFGRKSSLLVVRSESSEVFDLVDQISATLGPGPLAHFQIVASVLVEKAGEPKKLLSKAVLPARSGETVSQKIKRGSVSFDVEFQPTMGANGKIIDLRYAVSFGNEEDGFRVNASTTVLSGDFRKILIRKTREESLYLRLQPLLVDHTGEQLDEQIY